MFKTYANYDVPTAVDANAWLRQGIIPVANATERNAIPTPTEGMKVYRLDTNMVETHNGTTWVAGRIAGHASASAAQTFATSGTGAVVQMAQDYVAGGLTFTDVSDLFTVPIAGWYRIEGYILWALHATAGTNRELHIQVNGSSVSSARAAVVASQTQPLGVTHFANLAANDQVRLFALQTSTASLTATNRWLHIERLDAE